MKYLLSIFFLLFFTQQTEAQVPGYQGKRFYVGYELIPHYILKAVGIKTYNTNGEVEGQYQFSNAVNINYVIARNKILTVDFNYRKSGFADSEYDSQTQLYYDDFFRTTNKMLGLGIKRMNYIKKGYIAPVGNFFEFKAFWINSTVVGHGTLENVSNTPTSTKQSFNDFGIGLYWGMQTIWFDRLVPSYTFGITASSLHFSQTYSFPHDTKVSAFGGTYPGVLITGKLGIGVLLF